MGKITNRLKEFLFPGSGSGETEDEKQSERAETPTGRNAVRSGSYFSGARRNKHPLGLTDKQVKWWSLGALAIVVIDLVALGFISCRLLFGFTEKICYAFKMDGLSYVSHSFLQVEILIAYAVDFIIGGALVWLTLSLAGSFTDEALLKFRRKHILIIVAIFAAVFLLFTLISTFAGHKYDSYNTYRFLAPLMCYAGGCLFLGLSLLRFEIK